MPTSSLRSTDAPRLVRFGLTGGAGFAVDLGCLTVLKSGLGVPLPLATTSAYLIGGTVHYSLTRFWVFPQRTPGGELSRIGRYVLLVAANLGTTLLIVLGLSRIGVDYRLAKLFAVSAMFVINYLLVPRIVMKSPNLRKGLLSRAYPSAFRLLSRNGLSTNRPEPSDGPIHDSRR